MKTRKTKMVGLNDYMFANQFETYKPALNKIKLGVFAAITGASLVIPFTSCWAVPLSLRWALK